ncbi:AI-2E family transporter [Amphibacillus xylanus]|uniref:AI-2E family transporter n=1 Tax=Amphibacillus xylanus TaxID=1449 RepID=UPI0012DFAED8|nr:AI-2E family transporter [Amphibacillus xylanus]
MTCSLKRNAVSSNKEVSSKDLLFKKLVRYGVLAILTLIILFLIVRTFPNYRQFLSGIFKVSLPFILAIVLTYVLNPIVDKLTCRWIPRWLAILIIYAVFIVGITLLVYVSYPTIREQAIHFINQVPNLLETYRDWINRIDEVVHVLPDPIHHEIDELFVVISESSSSWLENKMISMGAISEYFISLAVVPVLLFYFLLDQNKMKMKFLNWIPKRYLKKTKQLIYHLNKDLAHYIRAQLIISFFVGLTTFIVYLILKIEFAFLLAIFMMIMNIIPYFGPFLGAAPAVLIALMQSPQIVLYLVIGIVVVQFIESNLLSPFILGYNLRTHPVLVILVLLIGSEVAGIFGMIIAVPVLVVIRSVITFNPFQST